MSMFINIEAQLEMVMVANAEDGFHCPSKAHTFE